MKIKMHAPIPAKKGIVTVSRHWVPRSAELAGAGVPVPSVDDGAIAAALHVVCAAARVAKSGPLRRHFLAGDTPPPNCPNWKGVGNAV